MGELLLRAPLPRRDDNVALDALETRRLKTVRPRLERDQREARLRNQLRLWPRLRNCAIAGSSRTRFRRGLRVSSPTIARPCAVNARPSGLPSRSPSRHASRSAAVPPPAGRSSSRAIVEDLSLSR